MTVRAVAPERSRPRLTSQAGFLLIALTLLALIAIAPSRAYLSERGHIAELQRKAEGLERANAVLQSEIVRLHEPAEKERLARECLGDGQAGGDRLRDRRPDRRHRTRSLLTERSRDPPGGEGRQSLDRPQAPSSPSRRLAAATATEFPFAS
jgi:cell division protein FtsB